MIRHIVLFRWTPGTSGDEVQAITDALRALPAVVPELRDYRVGPDLGLSETTWDFAVVADFDSVDDRAAYVDHPDHQAVVQRIAAVAADRVAVQYELSEP